MPDELARIVVCVKTYPESSTKNLETVCTAGVRDDGRPIRLYPVPLRYMGSNQQYKLYTVIEARIERNSKDPRPESYKLVDPDRIKIVGQVASDKNGWRSRREIIMKDPRWIFGSVQALHAAQKSTGRSLGLLSLGRIEKVSLKAKTEKERIEHESKMSRSHSQHDALRPAFKELEFLSHSLSLHFRCAEACVGCLKKPHRMQVFDWGLLELGRRDGWPAAKARLEEISNLDRYDFRLFMGNFRLYPSTFGDIGLWYPKIIEQNDLF